MVSVNLAECQPPARAACALAWSGGPPAGPLQSISSISRRTEPGACGALAVSQGSRRCPLSPSSSLTALVALRRCRAPAPFVLLPAATTEPPAERCGECRVREQPQDPPGDAVTLTMIGDAGPPAGARARCPVFATRVPDPDACLRTAAPCPSRASRSGRGADRGHYFAGGRDRRDPHPRRPGAARKRQPRGRPQ